MNVEQNRMPIWAKYTAITMVASSALAGCTSSPESRPTHSEQPTMSQPTDQPTKAYVYPSCEAQSSPTDIAAAAQLIAEPGNKYLKTISMSPATREAGIHKVITTAAHKYDLTVYDGRVEVDNWYTKIKSKHSPTFQQVYAFAHGYMARLGVDLEIGKAYDPNYSYGSRRPTATELQTNAAKYDLVDTVAAFSTVPRQYVALAGLKHIYLTAGTDKTTEGYTDATSKENDAYYKDIKEADGPQADLHELSHMIDGRECYGAIFSDPGWTRLNGVIDLDTGKLDDTSHISYEDRYLGDSIKRLPKEQLLEISHNKTAYCKLVAADNTEAHQVMTYSNYHPNVAEDKAETMKNIASDSGWADITSKRFPHLYSKFRLSLARLYHVSPQLAEYFAAVSDRTETFSDPLAPKC